MKHSTKKSLLLQGKDNNLKHQKSIVFQSFYNAPKTMKECDKEVGIMRESICWFCRDFRKENKLFVVKKVICTITKRLVNQYSTNPELTPISKQTKLF
jgi:recombinational DNA repair protein RecR